MGNEVSTESGQVRGEKESGNPVAGLRDSSLLVCGSLRCDGFSRQGPIPAGLRHSPLPLWPRPVPDGRWADDVHAACAAVPTTRTPARAELAFRPPPAQDVQIQLQKPWHPPSKGVQAVRYEPVRPEAPGVHAYGKDQLAVFSCNEIRALPNRKMDNRFTAVGGYSESQLGMNLVMETPDFEQHAVHGPCERIDVPGSRACSRGLGSELSRGDASDLSRRAASLGPSAPIVHL